MKQIASPLVILSLLFGAVVCYVTDPDATRNVIEIIESRNLKAETHLVTTDDGYILTVHRIVNTSSPVKNKRPIILQHGLESSSVDWMIDSPDLGIEFSTVYFEGKIVSNNLAFGLIIQEYDVWLPNSRGNRFSRKHIALDPDRDSRYWEFSFDEMSKYDLPAVIEYIQEQTKRKTIGYVGHSQGTAIMFGLLSEKPHYAEIIQPAIMLAPVARVKHMKSPIKYLNFLPMFKTILQWTGGEFIRPPASQDALSRMCESKAVASMVCSNAMFLLCGFNSVNMNMSRVHVYVKHAAAGTSTFNMLHYLLNYKNNGEFRKYDFGKSGNFKAYGSPYPPEYDLKKITSDHVALIYGDNDWLADPEDVKFIINQIGEKKLRLDYRIPNRDWNHLDFIYSLKAAETIYGKVVELLSHYRNIM